VSQPWAGRRTRRVWKVTVLFGRDSVYIGLIKERVWYGEDGMEHVRTRKEPQQAIPTFADTVKLLMLVSLGQGS
jgi:hypothetical protein